MRSFFMGGILRVRPSRCVLTNMINASPYLSRVQFQISSSGLRRGSGAETLDHLSRILKLKIITYEVQVWSVSLPLHAGERR